MSSLVLPNSNIELPPSMQMTDKQSIGPVTVGDQFPWRGLVFRVSRIFGNDHNDFLMVVAPAGVTGGFVKRINGKKGKKASKTARRRNKVGKKYVHVPAHSGASV